MSKLLIHNFPMNYSLTGKGFSLLFIHGYTDSSKIWKSQVARFSPEYLTVAVDLRGHGDSGGPETGYSILELSEDVYEFMQKLMVSRAVVVGHSMGGMIAQQLCIAHSENVRGLVLCSTGASGADFSKAGGFDCLAAMEQLNRFGLESFIKNGAEDLFAEDTSSSIVDSAVSEELRTSSHAALGCLKGMWECNLHDKLHKIKVPTLILVGDRDRATPLQCSETLKKAISGSELEVIGNCGHMMPVEKPKELNNSLQSFLQTIQRATD